LTERIFWYSKRAPNVAAIEAESAVNEVLSTPEVTSTLQIGERMSKLAESTPGFIASERKALFAELDARQTLLTNTLDELRPIVANGNSLVHSLPLLATNVQQTLAALQQTLQVADQVGHHLGINEPSAHPSAHPFDIQDYTIAFTRLNEAVTNLNQLSLNANQFGRSEAWTKGLKDLSDAADRRVNRIFIRLCLLVILAFVLGVIYRVITIRLMVRAQSHSSRTP